MVMIRCPNCGQRTLDVASACPKCGHVLLQNPLETHAWNDLVSCRRCGKHIERRLSECPFCGHAVRRARRVRRAAWTVTGLAAVVGGAYAAMRAGYLEPLWPAGRPEVAQVASPASPPGDAAAAVDSEPTIPTMTLPIAAAPPPTAADTAAGAPATRRTERVRAAPLETRWTVEWANVREGRGIDTPVVRVLAPGRQVNVSDMRNGWWAVYENGALRGYIANSVLAARPPTAGP